MTTINDINDLARILRENPEWADTLRSLLLSQELQNLPQTTAELAIAVKAVHDRMEGLEGEVKSQGRRLDTVQGDIADMKNEQAVQGGRISHLIGDDYESKAAWFGRRRLRSALGVTAVELLYHYRKQGVATLTHIIQQATRYDSLSPQDADDLEDSDLIFMVRQDPAQSEPDAYVVAEASVTIQESDVERARRRAGILDSVTQVPVTPAVIGVSITSKARVALEGDVLAVGMDGEGQSCQLSEAPDEGEETRQD